MQKVTCKQLLSFFLVLMTSSYVAASSKIIIFDQPQETGNTHRTVDEISAQREGDDLKSESTQGSFQIEEFNSKDLYSKCVLELQELARRGDRDAQKICDLHAMQTQQLFTKVLKMEESDDALFVFTKRWITQQEERTFCDCKTLMTYLENQSKNGHVGLHLMLGIIYGDFIDGSLMLDYQKSYDHLKLAAQHQCIEAFRKFENLKKRVYAADDSLLRKISQTFSFARSVLSYRMHITSDCWNSHEHHQYLKGLNDEELEIFADHGDATAQHFLGSRLYFNKGIGYMCCRPLKLFEMAAYSNNKDAQERLGDLYTTLEKKDPLSREYVLGLGMYTLAANQGSVTAKEKLIALFK